MIFVALADLVLLLHFAFIGFVTVGVVLVFRRPRSAWLHVPCVLWGAWIELRRGTCPLTPLENRFRQLGGEAGYIGGFIDHYLGPIIYPLGLTHGTQMALGVALVVFNVVAYALIIRRRQPAPTDET
jgi:hypothetical protein